LAVFNQHPGRPKQFYGVIIVATVVGMLINFLDINPIDALSWTAATVAMFAAAKGRVARGTGHASRPGIHGAMRRPAKGGFHMLWALVIILLLLWLGGFSLSIAGSLIHLLLVVAVIIAIYNLIVTRGHAI
jgi:Family of unknown function (DUF5670)